MVELSGPCRGDRFLNAMCGSGTILIERAKRAGTACAWGVDDAPTALKAAHQNASCAGVQDRGCSRRYGKHRCYSYPPAR